jgi:hypothetical protein
MRQHSLHWREDQLRLLIVLSGEIKRTSYVFSSTDAVTNQTVQGEHGCDNAGASSARSSQYALPAPA